MATTRGTAFRIRRSLRARIYAASGFAFFGLAALLCLVLPKAYEHQAGEDLTERTATAARGLSSLMATHLAGSDSETTEAFDKLTPWLVAQPDLESVLLIGPDGRALGRWPAESPVWSDGSRAGEIAGVSTVQAGKSFVVAHAPVPVPGGPGPVIFVRTSTARLVHDLENVRWLFSSIFLLGGAAFFVLTKYLTQTILLPLEDIRRAARNLADGEPDVDVPEFGDDEIAELGGIIRTLGDSRRHSRILRMPRPGFGGFGPEPASPGEAHGADRAPGPGANPLPGSPEE